MNAITYAAVLGTAFVVGAAAIAILAAYLIDRQASRLRRARRHRSAVALRDPYDEAQALAAHRRERVPAHASGRGGASWS